MSTKKLTFKKIDEIIDKVIAGETKADEHKQLYDKLTKASFPKINFDDINLLTDMALKLANSKARKLPVVERDFWLFLNHLSRTIYLRINNNNDDEDQGGLIAVELLGLAVKILYLKKEKTQRYVNRVCAAIELISNIISEYEFLDVKNHLIAFIENENADIQFSALNALENYFLVFDEEIDKELVEKLDDIAFDTRDRSILVTCMQIQINAGEIDEITALSVLDNWKERNYPHLYGDDDNDEFFD